MRDGVEPHCSCFLFGRDDGVNTWLLEEYVGFPLIIGRLQRANCRKPPGISREKVQYGDDKHQYILVFRPVDKAAARENSILFIHGGGWAIGSPDSFAFVGSYFAGLGYNTILCGYRHAPVYKYPAQLEDVSNGLQAGIRALEQRGCKIRKVIAAGESAGAQLAGLLVLDENNMRKQGISQELFSALVLVSGPMDFSYCGARQIRLGLRGFLGSRYDYWAADPIRYIKEGTLLPVFCIHGSRDCIVDIRSARSFYDRITGSHTGESKFVTAQGKHHLDLLYLFLDSTDNARLLEGFVNKIEKCNKIEGN